MLVPVKAGAKSEFYFCSSYLEYPSTSPVLPTPAFSLYLRFAAILFFENKLTDCLGSTLMTVLLLEVLLLFPPKGCL